MEYYPWRPKPQKKRIEPYELSSKEPWETHYFRVPSQETHIIEIPPKPRGLSKLDGWLKEPRQGF